MAMLYVKKHDGILSNHAPVVQLSSAPWWVQSFSGVSSGHVNSSHAASGTKICGDHLGAAKQGRGNTGQDLERGVLTRFPMFSESSKSLEDAQKPPLAISPHSECTQFSLGCGQPTICAKYPYGEPLYELFSPCGQQIPGRMMLPLNLTTDEGPIYVNAKQYNGILRRRKSRAKAEHENKTVKVRKPYMHVSRHLHAMRRLRGSGGRFVNTKNLSSEGGVAGTKKDNIGLVSQPIGSPRSEVLQSASRTSNSPKEGNGSIGITSGSEATSTFTQLPVYSFPDMTEKIPQSIVMPCKWVAAANYCCSLKF